MLVGTQVLGEGTKSGETKQETTTQPTRALGAAEVERVMFRVVWVHEASDRQHPRRGPRRRVMQGQMAQAGSCLHSLGWISSRYIRNILERPLWSHPNQDNGMVGTSLADIVPASPQSGEGKSRPSKSRCWELLHEG